MLLNDDTIVQAGAFQAMISFMDSHPEAGVAGAALLNRMGRLNTAMTLSITRSMTGCGRSQSICSPTQKAMVCRWKLVMCVGRA